MMSQDRVIVVAVTLVVWALALHSLVIASVLRCEPNLSARANSP
jgi:hypothetical protein